MLFFHRLSWWTSAYFSKKTLYEFLAAWNNPSHHRNHWDIQHPYIYIYDMNIYIYICIIYIQAFPDTSRYLNILLYTYVYTISRILPILLYPRPGKRNSKKMKLIPSCLTIWVSSWVKPWLPCGSCAWCVWYGSWSQGAPAGWSHGCFLHIYFHFFHLSRPFIATFSPRLVNPKGSE